MQTIAHHAKQLGRQMAPRLHGQNPVFNSPRKIVRPLADGLVGAVQGFSSGPNSPPKQVQGNGFSHSAGLNHSSVTFATIVRANHAQSATMVESGDYGDRLQAALKRGQVTAAALAGKLGVTYQAVKKVLDGKSVLNTPNNAKAARHLGVRSDWLALGDGDMAIATVEREASGPIALNAIRSLAGNPMAAAMELWKATRTTSTPRRKALMNLLEELMDAETDIEARDIAGRVEALLAPTPSSADRDAANG